MKQLTIKLFGPPRVEVDGILVELPLRKSTALLAYLSATNRAHARSTLATLFWPEADDKRSKGALRYTLAMLNAAIGDGWLYSTRERIGLHPEANIQVDVIQVEALAARVMAHGHALSHPCPLCAPLLKELLNLQQGRLLAGFGLSDSVGFEDWHLLESERLEQIQANALGALIALYRSAGNAEAALPFALRLVSLDSLHEEANESLIRLYAEAGKHAAALRQYQTFQRLLLDELQVAPSQQLQAFAAQLRGKTSANAPVTVRVPETALPPQTSRLYGREQEVAAINELLEIPTTRLLTLIGPGGSGKTRLALAIAYLQRELQRPLVYLPLAGVANADAFATALASALGIDQRGSVSVESLILNALSDSQLLLVIDNMEHLLLESDEAREPMLDLFEAILDRAPQVRILTTSRQRLHLQHENLYPVRGLDFPEWLDGENIESYGAIKMFVARARRVNPGFQITHDTAQGMLDIVRLLAGQPLAIELAAAWCGTMSPAEIAEELRQGIDLLVSNDRNVPDRQRSMRATYHYTWNRLPPNQQKILQALAVFRGGFTARAAMEVASANKTILQRLIDHSLIASEETINGTRYGMHELLRQFASEMSIQTGSVIGPLDTSVEESHAVAEEIARLRTRHAHYFLLWTVAEMQANPLRGRETPNRGENSQRLQNDFDNLQAAWAWALESRDHAILQRAIRYVAAYYHRNGYTLLGYATCAQVAEQLESETQSPTVLRLLAYACAWQAAFALNQTRASMARDLLDKTWAILQGDSSDWIAAFAAYTTARLYYVLANLGEALHWGERALSLAQSLGDFDTCGHALEMIGRVHWLRGENVQAARSFERGLAIFRETGDVANIVVLLGGLYVASVLLEPDRDWSAIAAEAEHLAETLLDPREKIRANRAIGWALINAGDFAYAQRILEESVSLAHRHNQEGPMNEEVCYLGFARVGNGEYEDAAQLMRALYEDARRRQLPRDTSVGMTICALAEIGQGNIDVAHALLSESLLVYENQQLLDDLSFTRMGLAMTYRARGDHASARQVTLDAMQAAKLGGSERAAFNALVTWAIALADEGLLEEAVEVDALLRTKAHFVKSAFMRKMVAIPMKAIVNRMEPAAVAQAHERGTSHTILSMLEMQLHSHHSVAFPAD